MYWGRVVSSLSGLASECSSSEGNKVCMANQGTTPLGSILSQHPVTSVQALRWDRARRVTPRACPASMQTDLFPICRL